MRAKNVDPDPWMSWTPVDYLRHYLEEATKDLDLLGAYDDPMAHAARSHIADALRAVDRLVPPPKDTGQSEKRSR